ncbi:MAG: type VI secretion protein [Wolbachia endosymbiont of Meromenopon meropis]|nr:type VI secretion protein [Wolbachia endosymbiont of Meromenopon meropis]
MKKRINNLEKNESEIENRVVTVGSNQGHRVLMIAVLLFLVSGVCYFYFSTSSSDEESVEVIKKNETKQDVQELKEKLEQVPDNTMIHERIITDLPPLPPLLTPHSIPEVKQSKKEEKEEEKSRETSISNRPVLSKQDFRHNSVVSNLPTTFSKMSGNGYPRDRRGTQMLVISSGGKENRTTDPVLSDTSVQQNVVTKVGKLGFMITQGKIIDVILETAISSDLRGMLRAVVSDNVYAETGDTVLIPRGSRLIGNYSFESNIARARINVNWSRIILPHGIDIAISSHGTDELGRVGVDGIVDNKTTSALFSSVLLAGVSIGSAVIGQKASNLADALTPIDLARAITATEIDISPLKDIISNKNISKKDTDNDKWKLGLGAIKKIKNAFNDRNMLEIFKRVVRELDLASVDNSKIDEISLEDIKQLLKKQGNKSIYEEIINKSVSDFSKDIRDIISKSTDKKPTVYVDQGTALKVFVNQDIVFPIRAILNNQ